MALLGSILKVFRSVGRFEVVTEHLKQAFNNILCIDLLCYVEIRRKSYTKYRNVQFKGPTTQLIPRPYSQQPKTVE